jgi:hypothetical protein
MKLALMVVLHGLCGLAGYWLVSSPKEEAPAVSQEIAGKMPARSQTGLPRSQPASPPPAGSEAGLALLTPENWGEAIHPLSQARKDELPALLRGLLRNPFPDAKRRLLGQLFQRWAELDLQGALTAMHGISSPQHKEVALRAILSIWTETNEEAAWRYVTALDKDSVLQEAGIVILLGLNAGSDPLRYAAWAVQLDDVFLREKALTQIGDTWMSEDPNGALASVMIAGPKRLRDYVLSIVCHRSGVDHEAGLEIVSQLSSQAERGRLSETWLGAYADRKPREAFQWLVTQSGRAELQKSAGTLGGILAAQAQNFADLHEMALRLPAGPLRDAFAARAADKWAFTGRSLHEAEALLALCSPCLEREAAQETILHKSVNP